MSVEATPPSVPVLSEATRAEMKEQERFELAHFLRTLALALAIAVVMVVLRLYG
jgi:predicted nucleic acid-binding Zn ribbon protein